jgi:hypothetical protein
VTEYSELGGYNTSREEVSYNGPCSNGKMGEKAFQQDLALMYIPDTDELMMACSGGNCPQ